MRPLSILERHSLILATSKCQPQYLQMNDSLRVINCIDIGCSLDPAKPYEEKLWVLCNDGWGGFDWYLVRQYDLSKSSKAFEIIARSDECYGESNVCLLAGLLFAVDGVVRNNVETFCGDYPS